MRSIDLGMELGAKIYVMWGGREGVEADACRDAREAIKRYRDCVNFLCDYVRDQKYDVRFALEAKPNEPRSDLYLPTTGRQSECDRLRVGQLSSLSDALAEALDNGFLSCADPGTCSDAAASSIIQLPRRKRTGEELMRAKTATFVLGEATKVPPRSPGRAPPYWKSRVLRRQAFGDEDDGQGPWVQETA